MGVGALAVGAHALAVDGEAAQLGAVLAAGRGQAAVVGDVGLEEALEVVELEEQAHDLLDGLADGADAHPGVDGLLVAQLGEPREALRGVQGVAAGRGGCCGGGGGGAGDEAHDDEGGDGEAPLGEVVVEARGGGLEEGEVLELLEPREAHVEGAVGGGADAEGDEEEGEAELQHAAGVDADVLEALARAEAAQLEGALQLEDDLAEVGGEAVQGGVEGEELALGVLEGEDVADGAVFDLDLLVD